jgi:hypothetical protein
MANQRGGSEWEPIEAPTRWTRLPTHISDSTTQVGQDHIATGVLLILGTNKQPFEPKQTNTHSGNLHGLLLMLHWSDRWPALVRPVTPVKSVDRAGQAGGYNSRTTNVPESLSDFSRLWNKNTLKIQTAQKKNPTQIQPKCLQNCQELTDQHQHNPKTHGFSNSLEANPTKGSHRSDRSRAPVRPV